MNLETFTHTYQQDWTELETLLQQLEKPVTRAKASQGRRFPRLFRRVCKQLALARERNYSAVLIDHLNQLVLRGHQQLYRKRELSKLNARFSLIYSFPRAVRKQARLFWLAFALFFVPYFGMIAVIAWQPDMVYTVLSPEMTQQYEAMYAPEGDFGRNAQTDVMMFGFYIYNNTGIGFRTFAGGLLFGLGSIFFLVINGLSIGAVFGHLYNVGSLDRLLPFIAGHSAPELLAIVLSGQAGLKLGLSLLIPGNKGRLHHLRDSAHQIMPVVYGMAALFIFAAGIEGFFSASLLPAAVKYSFGIGLWVLLAAYLALAGREHEY